MPNSSLVRLRAPLCVIATMAYLAFASATQASVPTDPLTLLDALARAAAYDPTQPASQARVRAARANVDQAGVRPNPTAGVELENFAGTGAMSLFDRTETTVYYEQTFERGGKREARVSVADAQVDVAEARAVVRQLDLLEQVQVAWIEVLAAQERLKIAEQQLAIAVELEQDVARRVRAARDPLFAGQRAHTDVLDAQIAVDRARADLLSAKITLAAYWGGTPDFELPTDAFTTVAPLTLPPLLDQSPDLTLLAAERTVAIAQVDLERSRSVQDPRVRGGIRYFSDGGDAAFVVGASIPLGRYDTNQGGIARAEAERTAADVDLHAEREMMEREVVRLTARRAATASEIARLEADVIPSAERATRQVRDGFNRGGGAFTYLEVTQAERALLDARSRRIELLRSYHLDGARLDRMTGAHLTFTRTEDR